MTLHKFKELPGLSKHGQILEILIFKNMPDFYGKMVF